MSGTGDNRVRISIAEAEALARRVLTAAGASEAMADVMARALTRAEAEGLAGVGLKHLITYSDALAAGRIDDRPRQFSGGMQQRLQIARNLVTAPRLVFMDEPTGGLDVSVQARLLDLIRGLVRDMALSVVIVTHDLAVVRLLADRLLVMKDGRVIEAGLTDQVLDDPQEPYTQVLVSSVLQV